MMSIDMKWLEESFFKIKLSNEQKELLEDVLKVVSVKAKEVVVAQGRVGNAIYVVYQGAAHVDADYNGEILRVSKATSGDLIGEMSFLRADDASATVSAYEDSVLYKLTRNDFTRIMQQSPELAYSLFALMLSHTASVIRHMNAEKAAVQHYMAGNHF